MVAIGSLGAVETTLERLVRSEAVERSQGYLQRREVEDHLKRKKERKG